MKIFKKITIFLFTFVMLFGLSNISYADSLKPTKTIKLNKSAFIADLAVYKGKLYYTDIKFKNPHKGPDGSVSVVVFLFHSLLTFIL